MGKTKGKVQKRTKRMRNAKKPKKTYKLRPNKMAALVLSAIHDLRESKGTTPSKISGYISYTSNLPENQIKKQVNSALKRGVEYGVLRRYRGHYFLPAADELDRANRVAMRFARLTTPVPSNLISSLGESSVAMIESAADVKKPRNRKFTYPLLNKNRRRVQSLPVSPVASSISSNKDDSSNGSDVD